MIRRGDFGRTALVLLASLAAVGCSVMRSMDQATQAIESASSNSSIIRGIAIKM